MKRNPQLRTVLSYSRTQQIGFLVLIGTIVLLQFCIEYTRNSTAPKIPHDLSWLSQQQLLDSIENSQEQKQSKIFPFNPNFISDYKGYQLGMSVAEIDRLQQFRAAGKFVNSAQEFQQVTGISEALLRKIEPYFKFPDWVKKKSVTGWSSYEPKPSSSYPKLDINTATKADLMAVYGIGDKLSDRIIEYKTRLGAIVHIDQIDEIWGLAPEVGASLKERFSVKTTTGQKKININQASVKELMELPYFKYALAKEIVIYRSFHGDIKIEDLAKIKHFPVDNIKIIALYLEF